MVKAFGDLGWIYTPYEESFTLLSRNNVTELDGYVYQNYDAPTTFLGVLVKGTDDIVVPDAKGEDIKGRMFLYIRLSQSTPPPTLATGDIVTDPRGIKWNIIEETSYEPTANVCWWRVDRRREQ